MVKICHIIGASAFSEQAIPVSEGDLVIAADGGYSHLGPLAAKADIVIGDFDSLPHVPVGPVLMRYPRDKDETDMMLAVREGLRRGYRLFLLYGGLGGRLDHTLANIQTLAYLAERNANGYLVGHSTVITAVRNGRIAFPDSLIGIVSVFSLDSYASGVAIEGLKYELEGAYLKSSEPMGVSNEFTGRPSQIEVKEGTLLVIWNEDTTVLANRVRNEG